MSQHSTESKSVNLTSHLTSVKDRWITICDKEDPQQYKKHARKELSLQMTSEQVGFLHAVLIRIGEKYFALAGHSGIGKTTYGSRLNNDGETGFLANDWIVVEKEDSGYFASDLNYPEHLRGEQKIELSGVIFLTNEDMHKRDAFFPTDSEFADLMRQTFDTATTQEIEVLSLFWRENILNLPFSCVVPARGKSESYILETIKKVLNLNDLMTQSLAVGIIGLGDLGSQAAAQIGNVDRVEQIHLHNRTYDKAVGLSLDFNHGSTEGKEKYQAHKEMIEIFKNSSVVFLTFRNASAVSADGVPERWQKIAAHLEILNDVALCANEVNFSGVIFVVSNPVDFLTYALYEKSQSLSHPLRTFQIYGVGLGLDAMRALHYGKKFRADLRFDDIEIFGNHSDTLLLKTPLSDEENAVLLQLVKGASKEVRQNVPRTIYGPAKAIEQALKALKENGSVHLTTIQGKSFIGRKINFRNALPQLATALEGNQVFDLLIAENRRNIEEYIIDKINFI